MTKSNIHSKEINEVIKILKLTRKAKDENSFYRLLYSAIDKLDLLNK